MTITHDFIKKLQDATNQKFWENPPEKATFQDVLDQYAIYYHSLSSDESRKTTSIIFWNQVKAIGTPIIEERSDGKCEVHFLFPIDKLSDCTEKPGEKKNLYLQGDFHGYDTTAGRQLLSHFKDTGIMHRRYIMPKDAIITYRYIQLEPSLKGRTPTEHHGSDVIEPVPESFFPEKIESIKEVITPKTEKPSDQFWGEKSQLVDECSTHRPTFFGIDECADSPEKIFRVNAEPSRARLSGEKVNWSTLLSTEDVSHSNRKFVYHDTFYSDLKGDLKKYETPSGKPATPNQLHSDDLPFSQFTRVIHVFKPASDKIENVVIVNDGIAYLLMGVMEQFETMVKEGMLTAHTAFVFITCLPGLAKTVSALDPKFNLPGMRERVVDYYLKIETYADFIENKLLPELDLKLQLGHSKKIMIGSSLSGTASLYMALNRANVADGFIVQSPSPFNRSILINAVKAPVSSKLKSKIHLSSGRLESPEYAANTNWLFAVELSKKLEILLQSGAHGHQFLAWSLALEQSLTDISTQLRGLSHQSKDLGKHAFFAHKRSKSADLHQVSQHERKSITKH